MFAIDIVGKCLGMNTEALSKIGEYIKLYASIPGTVIDVIDGRLGKDNVLYNVVRYDSDKIEIVFLAINTGESRGETNHYLIVEMNSKGFLFAVKHELYSKNIEEFCRCFWSGRNAAIELKYDWEFNAFVEQYSLNSYVPVRILMEPYKGIYQVSICGREGKLFVSGKSSENKCEFIPTAKLFIDYKKDKDITLQVGEVIQAYLTRVDNEKKLLKFELRPKQISLEMPQDHHNEDDSSEKEVYQDTGKSPFMYYEGEVIENMSNVKSAISLSFDIRQGYINEEALIISRIVLDYGFMTSKLLTFVLKNFDAKNFCLERRYENAYMNLRKQAATTSNLQKYIIGKMVNTYGLLDAHRFRNPNNRNPSTLVVSVSRNGLALLKAKELVSEIAAYDASKDSLAPEILKRKLAENQLLMIQLAYFKEKVLHYLKTTTVVSKAPDSGNDCIASPSLIVGFDNISIIYEVIRRGPEGYDKSILEKLKRIGKIINNFETVTNKGILVFKQRPKVVLVCEDLEHIEELNKAISEEAIMGSDVELYYSYDRAVACIDAGTKEINVEKYADSHLKLLNTGELASCKIDDLLS